MTDLVQGRRYAVFTGHELLTCTAGSTHAGVLTEPGITSAAPLETRCNCVPLPTPPPPPNWVKPCTDPVSSGHQFLIQSDVRVPDCSWAVLWVQRMLWKQGCGNFNYNNGRRILSIVKFIKVRQALDILCPKTMTKIHQRCKITFCYGNN